MNSDSPYAMPYVSDAAAEVRAGFIRRTYAHLAGAILAFILLEALLFQAGIPDAMVEMLGRSRYSWLIVLLAFMGVSTLAQKWADSGASSGMQYAGLGLYVVAEAFIFAPLLWIAQYMTERNETGPIIMPAALITLLLFAGLTYTAFTTKKDFAFLGAFLKISCWVALGVIVAGIIFGFNLGLFFSALMVVVAGASILYTTSNIIKRYNPTQHVAASLALFASVALLFWYILRILMATSRRS
jgi:FtsH-binding integral membrane protein